MSKLYFRYGAMNCGKSSALMQVAYNYEQNNKKVIVIKSEIDTKGNNYLESRIGLKRKVDILLKENESIEKYYNKLDEISCVLVDEAQFLSEKQVDELYYITKYYNIPVICYGLKTDFQSKLFNGSKRLLELSDELDELITICRCGNIPLCGKCYLDEKRKYEEE